MEKTRKAIEPIKTKLSELVMKLHLDDEATQTKIVFSVLAGFLAYSFVKKAISNSEAKKETSGKTKKPENFTYKSGTKSTHSSKNTHGLSFFESESRRKAIKGVEYGLVFFIDPTYESSYQGMANIRFQLAENNKHPLFLDFSGKEIIEISINGKAIKNIEKYWHGERIELPSEFLTPNQNTVEIYFKSDFTSDQYEGGVNLFKDNEDQYVYTNITQFNAHQVFPCFDQPSLRAAFKLLLVTPEDWKVFSNDVPVNIDDISSGFSENMTQKLKQTLESLNTNWKLSAFDSLEMPVSSFGFLAGPFETINFEDKQNSALPHLSFNVKRSLSKELRIESEELSQILFTGIQYYTALLGRDYPFRKCDVFFLPEIAQREVFLAGCCVVDENLLTSFEADVMKRIDRSVEILQQIAFTWFGYSVSVDWLVDSWLDQGLSSFLAYLGLGKVVRSIEGKLKKAHDFNEKNIWSHFAYKRRLSLLEDTTQIFYPISVNFERVRDYSFINLASQQLRGAGAWKQFFGLVGEENFKRGIKKCFAQADKSSINTEMFIQVFDQILKSNQETPMGESLDKFITTDSFDLGSFDVRKWVKEWIQTEGLNHLEISWEKNNPLFNNMIKFKQTVESDGEELLRSLKMKIAFLDYEGQVFKVKDVFVTSIELFNLSLEDPQRIPSAFFLESEGNHMFVSNIESNSFDFFKKNLRSITDEVIISGVLERAVSMTANGNISAIEFCYLVVQLFQEKGTSLSPLITQQAIHLAHYVIQNFTPVKYQSELKAKIFEASYQLLMLSEEASTRSHLILNELWRFVAKADQTRKLLTILESQLENPERHYNTISLYTIYRTYQSCYFVEKNKRLSEEFVRVVQGSGFTGTFVEEIQKEFEMLIYPDADQEIKLLKKKKFKLESAESCEGLRAALGSVAAPIYVKAILEVFEKKGEEWTVQGLYERLNFVWRLNGEIKYQEDMLGKIGQLKVKGKEEDLRIWLRMKTAELNKKRAEYKAFERNH